MKRSYSIILWVLLCFTIGAVAGFLQSAALEEWYPLLNKSSLTPPSWLFPVAWSILYVLMGISVGLLWGIRSIYTTFLYLLFVVQLGFNFLWSIFFFTFRSPLLGFVDIILLDMFAVFYFALCYVVKRSASWYFIPYILWLAFATYLNGYIILNN